MRAKDRPVFIRTFSPNADLDTIHRVYRILAQRFHPDNRETGSETFRALNEACQILGDPEKRAFKGVDLAETLSEPRTEPLKINARVA